MGCWWKIWFSSDVSMEFLGLEECKAACMLKIVCSLVYAKLWPKRLAERPVWLGTDFAIWTNFWPIFLPVNLYSVWQLFELLSVDSLFILSSIDADIIALAWVKKTSIKNNNSFWYMNENTLQYSWLIRVNYVTIFSVHKSKCCPATVLSMQCWKIISDFFRCLRQYFGNFFDLAISWPTYNKTWLTTVEFDVILEEITVFCTF